MSDEVLPSEHHVRELAGLLPGVVFEIGPEGRLTFVNAQFFTLFGYTTEDIGRGLDPLTLIVPAHRERAAANAAEVLKGTHTGTDAYTALRKDGSVFPVLVRSTPILSDGKPIGIRGIALDISPRAHVEQALRESERLYMSTIDAFDEPLHIVDPELRFVVFNTKFKQWTEALGIPVICAGQDVFEVFTFLTEDVREEYRRVLSTGEAVVTRDENVFGERKVTTETHKIPLFEDNKVAHVVTIIRDITDEVGMVEALRESEERFRAQYRSIPLPTFTWQRTDDDAILVDYNDAALKATQGKVSEHVGLKLEELRMHSPELADEIERCFAARGAAESEVSYCDDPTGDVRSFAVSCAFVPPDLVMVHFDDVTERNRAQAAARQREDYLNCLTEISTLLLAATDLDVILPAVIGRLREVSGADRCCLFRNHTGFRGVTLSTQQIEDCAPGVMCQKENAVLQDFDWEESGVGRWQRILSQGGVVKGAPREFCEHARQMLESQGIEWILVLPVNVAGRWWGGVSFDICRPGVTWPEDIVGLLRTAANAISAAIQREENERTIESQRANMASAARLSSLGVMASGVAHEINNPLAIISGASEQLTAFLAGQPMEPAKVLSLTRNISRNVARVKRIIRGLRNLARDEAGGPFVGARLDETVADALEVCRARFRAHNISLTISHIPPQLTVECQATQIAQVLLNLLNNAHDAAMIEGRRAVTLMVKEAPDHVDLAITDTGPGVPSDVQEKIFEPFFTTKEVGAGMGLGLSISRQIVERHHGNLFLDEACPNTSFVVRLPKVQPADGSASPTSPLPRST